MKFTKKVLFSLMVSMFLLSSIGHAETGDFYKKYKSEFDKVEPYVGKTYINDFVKKYDSKYNTFDCGKLNFDCQIMAQQYKLGLNIASYSAQFMKVIVKDPDELVKDKGLNRFKGYLTTLANSLLPLFLIWHMMVMALRRLGDPDDYHQAMNQKLVSVFAGAAMLGLYQPMFSLILQVQNDVLNGILGKPIDVDTLKLMLFSWGPQYSLVIFLFVFFAIIVFGLALLYRFVALAFMFMVGPLAIATILNDEFNYFSVWIKYIINNIVTFSLQAIAYVLCLQILTGENSYVMSFNFLLQPVMAVSLTLVVTFFSLTIPFILGNLGSSSGTGRSIGRVARVLIKK